jgi:nucleoside-diphosphate-sugar epimerase
MASDVNNQAFTIATGTAVTLADAVALLAKLMGFDHPARFLDASERTRFSAAEVLNYDVSKAAEQLGWTAQIDLREGLGLGINKANERSDDDSSS